MNYYTIVTAEKLNESIPEDIKTYMGYDGTIEVELTDGTVITEPIDYTLEMCAFNIVGELLSGDFVINVQLSKNIYINNKCVQSPLSEAELAIVFAKYGEENVFTDYSDLEFKITKEDE